MTDTKKQKITSLFLKSLSRMPHVLLLDTELHGLTGYAALSFAARCFAEENGRVSHDSNGRTRPAPPHTHIDDLSERSFEVGGRVREAARAGVTFVVCYKPPDEPEWRAAWSPDLTPWKAAITMLVHIMSSLPRDG